MKPKRIPGSLALVAAMVPMVLAHPVPAQPVNERQARAQDQPNVVFMMVDNLGWGELGVYGGGILRGTETPRLDMLASEDGHGTSNAGQ